MQTRSEASTVAELELTPAQHLRLQQAARMIEAGAFSAEWPLMRKGRERTMVFRACDKLCTFGLLKPYAHGGYEVTPAGHEWLAAHPGEASCRML